MTALTTEWQNLGSATLYNNITIILKGKYSQQNTTGNYSIVQFALVNSGSYWRTTNGTASFTGQYTDSIGCATYPNYIYDGTTIATIEKTAYHDANGDLSFNIGGIVSAIINSGTRTANISQVAVSLPHINRFAIATNGTNFNDEQNPTTTFSNPAGYRINARLEFTGGFVQRDNISNTGSYTYELTSAERQLLRQCCTGKTLAVRQVIATCIGGTTETNWSWIDTTMSIVNGNPTFNVSYEDINPTTLAITNNNQQIIQSNSTLQFNISNATALKEATLNKVKININGIEQEQSISSSTLAFNYGTINVSSNINANVVLVDSRGFETTIPVALTILSWSLPTAIITMNRKSNYYTETDITVDANYSSLDSKNTITIKMRKKKTSEGSYGAYTNLSDNVQSTFNADNLYEWDVQVLVQDSIGSTTYNLTLGIGQPIMFVDRRTRNVGIDCFPQSTNALEVKGNEQINGDLYIAESSGLNPHAVRGYIIEESGTGYIKYADGTMICYGTQEITTSATGTWGSLFASSSITGTDFAKAFTSIVSVVMTPLRGSTFWLGTAQTGTTMSTTKLPNFYILTAVSQSSTTFLIGYTAIGRWK